MRRINLAFLGIIVLFALFPVLNAGTITVPTSTYFGIPSYQTYISFDSIQPFGDAYRTGNVWTFDEFGLSVENANMTVTDFFTSHSFGCTLEGSSESISTSIIHAPSEGEPISVEGADSWNWDSTGFTTITIENSSDRDIFISWRGDSSSPSAPSKGSSTPIIPPYIAPFLTPQFAIIGLTAIIGGIGIFVFSAIWKKLSRPTRRKPRGIPHRKTQRKKTPPKPKKPKRSKSGRFV